MPALIPSPPALILALALPSIEQTQAPEQGAALAQLARLLGRANVAAESALDMRSWIAQQLGLVEPIPWAALLQHGEHSRRNANSSDSALLLEPVQMVATMNSVAMRPLPDALSTAQLSALAELLNPIFRDDGAEATVAGGQLLLRLSHAQDWHTTPLAQCAGQDLRDCLPRGEHAGLLRRWMTECQMALHRHAEQGHTLLGSVTGVWAWGEGDLRAAARLPTTDRTMLGEYIRLISDDPLLQALASYREQLAPHAALESIENAFGKDVVLWHGGEDLRTLSSLLRTARQALMNGTLRSIHFHLWIDGSAPPHTWVLQRWHLLRIWRAPRFPWRVTP